MANFLKTTILLISVLAAWCVVGAEPHRFSTVVTAQAVRDHLSTDTGLSEAIRWCQHMKVEKVYLETFRHGYQAEEKVLQQATKKLKQAGIAVSACVTPTLYGKKAKSARDFHVCHSDA